MTRQGYKGISYTENYRQWYNNLSDAEYIEHYQAWLDRDVRQARDAMIRRLVGNFHYPEVYDISTGAAEVASLISHKHWVKTIVDDRQENLVKTFTPNVDVRHVAYPAASTHQHHDLIVALNLIRFLDISQRATPDIASILRDMWKSGSDLLFDILLTDEPWQGLNDKSEPRKNFLRLGASNGFALYPYWEFPKGVYWHIGLKKHRRMNWLFGADAYQYPFQSNEEIYAALEFAYDDVSWRSILDLGGALNPDDNILSVPRESVLNFSSSEHYEVVLGLDLLSLIEQPVALAHYIIGHINADVFILSGALAKGAVPEYNMLDGNIGFIAHQPRIYKLIMRQVRRDYGYNSYVIRGYRKRGSSERNRMYLVVETGEPIPESILRAMAM